MQTNPADYYYDLNTHLLFMLNPYVFEPSKCQIMYQCAQITLESRDRECDQDPLNPECYENIDEADYYDEDRD